MQSLICHQSFGTEPKIFALERHCLQTAVCKSVSTFLLVNSKVNRRLCICVYLCVCVCVSEGMYVCVVLCTCMPVLHFIRPANAFTCLAADL